MNLFQPVMLEACRVLLNLVIISREKLQRVCKTVSETEVAFPLLTAVIQSLDLAAEAEVRFLLTRILLFLLVDYLEGDDEKHR